MYVRARAIGPAVALARHSTGPSARVQLTRFRDGRDGNAGVSRNHASVGSRRRPSGLEDPAFATSELLERDALDLPLVRDVGNPEIVVQDPLAPSPFEGHNQQLLLDRLRDNERVGRVQSFLHPAGVLVGDGVHHRKLVVGCVLNKARLSLSPRCTLVIDLEELLVGPAWS